MKHKLFVAGDELKTLKPLSLMYNAQQIYLSNVKCGPWFIILVTVRYRLKCHLAQKHVHRVLGKWNVITVELAILCCKMDHHCCGFLL